MRELAGHGALHPPVLLEGLVTLQGQFSAAFGAQARFGNDDLAPGIDHVTGLVAVPIGHLLAVRAAISSDG